MPPLYIPARSGADALLELDQVEWQLAGAVGPMNVPKLSLKLTDDPPRDEITCRVSNGNELLAAP